MAKKAKKAKKAKRPTTARSKSPTTTLKKWVDKLATANHTLEAVAALKPVSFACDNANVRVNITVAGQSGVCPCTLNLPIGIQPLHYNAQGTGPFTVTAGGGQVSPPIAGVAPDAGTVLIMVS